MSTRVILFLLALTPALALAQAPVTGSAKVLNASMRAVLLVNRPVKFTEAEWLKMMEKPVYRSLYPLRITQAMLDTLDVKELDIRYPYVIVRETKPD